MFSCRRQFCRRSSTYRFKLIIMARVKFTKERIAEILEKAQATNAEKQRKRVFPFDNKIEIKLFIDSPNANLIGRVWGEEENNNGVIYNDCEFKILSETKLDAFEVIFNGGSFVTCSENIAYVSGMDFHKVTDFNKYWNFICHKKGLNHLIEVKPLGKKTFYEVETDYMSVFLGDGLPMFINKNSKEFRDRHKHSVFGAKDKKKKSCRGKSIKE